MTVASTEDVVVEEDGVGGRLVNERPTDTEEWGGAVTTIIEVIVAIAIDSLIAVTLEVTIAVATTVDIIEGGGAIERWYCFSPHC